MSFTYTDPATTYRDAIRLLIGDTESAGPFLTDEEIAATAAAEAGITATAVPASRASALVAAAACAAVAAAKSSAEGGFSLGAYSESPGARAKTFTDLATSLRQRAGAYAAPRAVGLSRAANLGRDLDVDALQPAFRRGQHDAPGTSEDAPDVDPTLD